MICSLHKQTRSCVQLDTHTYTPIREKRQDEKENSRYQDYLLFRYLFFLKSRATAFNNETLKNSLVQVNLSQEETGMEGTQSYRVDNNTTWRVIGLNEDKTQLIITTGSPLKKASATEFNVSKFNNESESLFRNNTKYSFPS